MLTLSKRPLSKFSSTRDRSVQRQSQPDRNIYTNIVRSSQRNAIHVLIAKQPTHKTQAIVQSCKLPTIECDRGFATQKNNDLGLFSMFRRNHDKITWDVKGKVVLITGASSGIGKELAFLYAKRGAKLALVARRDKELNEVVTECIRVGAESAIAIVADVSVHDDCKRVVDKTVEKFGSLDAIVLNAGISMGQLVEQVTDITIFQKIMDINYFQCVNITHYALPHLFKTKGKICAISSIAALVGFPTRSGYCASKSAVNAYFDSLIGELELKNRGVQVTVVCPGVVHTDLNRTRLGATYQTKLEDGIPASEAATKVDRAIQQGKLFDEWGFMFKLAPVIRIFFPATFSKIRIKAAKSIVHNM